MDPSGNEEVHVITIFFQSHFWFFFGIEKLNSWEGILVDPNRVFDICLIGISRIKFAVFTNVKRILVCVENL